MRDKIISYMAFPLGKKYSFNNLNEERDHYYDYYLNRANKLADEILAYIKQRDNLCVE